MCCRFPAFFRRRYGAAPETMAIAIDFVDAMVNGKFSLAPFTSSEFAQTSTPIAQISEKSRPKAGPKRTTERAWPMHLPRPKEGKGISNSRPKVEPKSTTERGQCIIQG
ncbi:hypothetical protein LOK49_LG10G02708 [Camellia lanceoleosa]|uniref:Uncharacterized protein n=1 Tax=Camellia lanceoleosa TaxID=1840588 RepID=A0ACC0G9H8_9ERIC|nr:hypothetical protein LOK49_LG10G02708 [Camellia lanceoleosa]